MNTGATPPSAAGLFNSVVTGKWRAYKAQRTRAHRKAVENERIMVEVIAKALEQFGRQPTNKQLADMLGVSNATISRWKKNIQKRLATAPCPLCGSFVEGPKI